MTENRSHLVTWVSLGTGALLLLGTLGGTTILLGPDPAGSWVQFLGRFHPVILHLPIGLFVGGFTVELLRLFNRKSGLRTAANMLLSLTALTSVLAACLGLLLFSNGDYTGSAAFWHKWLGLAFAAGTLVLLAVRLKAMTPGSLIWIFLYPLLLVGLLALMSVAGHFGGSLTHGSGYLVEYAPGWLTLKLEEPATDGTPASVDPDDVYLNSVAPIFQEYCVKCHGPEKQKSDYRLDTYENLLRAGRNGKSPIVPYEPHTSFLVQLLWLHKSDDMAMPPDGKARPTADDILAITHWVSLGAPGPVETEEAMRSRLEAETAFLEAVQVLKGHGVVVLPLGLEEEALYVDFLNVRGPMPHDAWPALVAVKDRIAELKLTAMPVSADQWRELANATHLTHIDMSHGTNVNQAMVTLNTLPALKRLNLFGSDVTGSDLEQLDVSRLSALYLGETAVSEDVIAAFRKTHPGVAFIASPDMAELDAIEEATKHDSTRFDPAGPAQE